MRLLDWHEEPIAKKHDRNALDCGKPALNDFLRQHARQSHVPVFRLARLAVDRPVQGRGLGGQLLLAAGRRCLLAAAEVGGVALLIDAKSERAARWYSSYGAVPLVDTPLSLIIPLVMVEDALRSAGLR